MAETSDSHQNQPRVSVEEWLAATESEYQETARQVGESFTEPQLGQKHIAERKLSIVRSQLSLAAEAAARRFRIFSAWRWIWLFSNIWGTTLLALT